MKLLIVDNFDSFTNNIVNFFRGLADGLTVDVVRNDRFEFLSDPAFADYDAIVISPGPGNPSLSSDLGISKTILETETRPILGVCLGHQALVITAGGEAHLAPEPMHGRTSIIQTNQKGLFTGLGEKLQVMRYHSWTVNRDLPEGFVCDAWTDDGLVMGVRDTKNPRWGVQFHPESICTELGRSILQNFLREVAACTPDAPVLASPVAQDHKRQFHWRAIGNAACPIQLVEAQGLFEGRRPLLLESSLICEGRSRFSIVEVPDQMDTSVTYDVQERVVKEFSGRTCVATHQMSIFDYLESQHQPAEMQNGQPPFDFVGGCVGWLGYEMKSETLGVTSHTSETPDAGFRVVTQFLVVDHEEDQTYACISRTTDASSSDIEAAFADLTRIAEQAAVQDEAAIAPTHERPISFSFRHDESAYLDLVRSCQSLIAQGESYELCLTNTVTSFEDFDAWQFYKLLRQRNASIYGGYLDIGGTEVVTSSPERFLKLNHDNILESKPIKGTAARQSDGIYDRKAAVELRESEKERVENIMIVDLVRHDLAGVAVPGSVEVPKLCSIESYPAVHQLVSTIQARLRPELTGVDALKSCFPGGSMTGAPKIRSVEMLDQLEEGPRGVYSGALGWIGFDGQMDLSIVIRTLVKRNGKSTIGTGGAITYLSDPQDELSEIKTKSRALVRTLSELMTGDPENYIFVPSDSTPVSEAEVACLIAE